MRQSLKKIPQKILSGINSSLIELVYNGRFSEEKYSTKAYLQRLPRPNPFENILNMLLWMPTIDLSINSIITIYLIIATFKIIPFDNSSLFPLSFCIFLWVSSFYLKINHLLNPLFHLDRVDNETLKFMRKFVYFLRCLGFMLFIIVLVIEIINFDYTYFEGNGNRITIVLISLTVIVLIMLAGNALPFTYFGFIIRGKPLHPFFWIFSPILSFFEIIIMIFHLLLRIIQNFHNWLGKINIQITKKGVFLFLIIMSLLLSFFLLNYFLLQKLVSLDQETKQLYALFISITFFISTILIKYFTNSNNNYQTNFQKKINSKIEIREFYNLIDLVIIDKKLSIEKFLEFVRENDIVTKTPLAKYLLQTLAWMIQFSHEMNKLKLKVTYIPKKNRPLTDFDNWIVNFQKEHSSGLGYFSLNSLIEINRILDEQGKSIARNEME